MEEIMTGGLVYTLTTLDIGFTFYIPISPQLNCCGVKTSLAKQSLGIIPNQADLRFPKQPHFLGHRERNPKCRPEINTDLVR